MSSRILLTASLILALSLGAAAQTGNVPAKGKTTKSTEVSKDVNLKGAKVKGVEAVRLARDLVVLGQQKKSPEILVAACEILLDNQPGELAQKPVAEGPATRPADPQTAPRQPVLDLVRLLAQAMEYAANNRAVQAWVKQVQERVPDATRGPVGGPLMRIDPIPAGWSATYKVDFKGGEDAVVSIVGAGTADLDLFVYDSSGVLIDSDEDLTDTCLVAWRQVKTGTVTVVVKNVGLLPNEYLLVMH